MNHDDADALNRALDELANGVPVTGNDIDPDLLATVQWFHDLGEQTFPDPRFSARLEDELMNRIAVESRTGDVADRVLPRLPRTARWWSAPTISAPSRLPRWRWATGALVWVSWAIVIAIVAFTLAGPLQLWPDRSPSDSPAVAPAVTMQPDGTVDLATHPIVGAWIPSANPPGPRSLEVFHGDGTVTGVNNLSGTGVGVWRATGDRSGEFIIQWPNRNIFEGEYREGLSILTGTFTVAEDGSSYTGTYHVEISTVIGTQAEQYEGTVSGTRITLDQVAAATPEG